MDELTTRDADAVADPKEGPDATPYRIADKWQNAVSPGSGWVAIPMSLLRLQMKLKLSATDMVVLANLLAHWWDPKRAVFPRSTTIAGRMGVSKRTVQRSTEKMIDLGLIERVKLDDGKRGFRFDPLVRRLSTDIGLSFKLQGKESLDA